MSDALPDLDWYLDHVVVPAGPDREPVGPARACQAAWAARAHELRAMPPQHPVYAAIAVALEQGFVLTRRQARRMGMADAQVRRLVRRGEWCSARRGIVAVVAESDDIAGTVAATAAALARPGHVVSHRSAALVHGLPLLDRPTTPELTAREQPATLGARAASLVRGAGLHADDVASWFGTHVTTVARTVTDLARGDRAGGLIAADAALRERLVRWADLAAAARRCAGWPGARSAREVMALASPLAESPLESLARLCLHDAGLPPPELQVPIVDPVDGWRCRVDMLWPAQRVVLEADGRVKYTDRELWHEKRRQHRLEQLGYRVLRAIWVDVMAHPDELVERVRRCLHASPLL